MDTVRACFHYGFPIAQLLHRYKYQHRRDAGKICANLADLYWQLLNTSLNLETINQVDVILPIPQSRNKWKQRGFSQTETLSKAIGKRSGIPVHSRWLSMDNRARPNQAALSRKDRIKNLKEAFTVKDRVAEQLNGLNVLLVDDVMTTGATLESVGMLLKQMNVAKVSAFCLARTPPPKL
ncbi:ComF family protein [Oleiphilus messinensis]|nr:ComF family protein [Oleiphilus messinensis]